MANANELMQQLKLGKHTDYPEHYSADWLQAVPRQINRDSIGLHAATKLPFHGVDDWTGYELSWLNQLGVPQVAVARFRVPADSPNLIESKSFKLYLNSFNEQQWQDWQSVTDTMIRDLSACAGAPVTVKLFSLAEFTQQPIQNLPGQSIDDCLNAHPDQPTAAPISTYDYQPTLLAGAADLTSDVVSETLHSHLLKSNCLITNQPDWGSLLIRYRGPKIDRQALLRYLISFRRHNEFHEQCVERIFTDLMHYCGCQQLTVYARYTRRGGLDINPFRSNVATSAAENADDNAAEPLLVQRLCRQ
ncbi:NADPH-dependent 7-cyano-7-deazaguanine reductase QueF [Idiomarina xiamenensis]|uniref:NADPH-dependent 7-cyano-7-deazaguanine reductase n=1 Tax=Idiomarina xiamenensis 10-D-4 TaxID=740709 RepID=K2KAK2_9GAMM|nr:NADPH-dependent 7-cyano-7-deazaguanine reductase QueF [Idiomarina xiamenensis]EKE84863.1 7-cyano-7-deazaguanine reductase [Idiomarina xiamenensis 10-D-4]